MEIEDTDRTCTACPGPKNPRRRSHSSRARPVLFRFFVCSDDIMIDTVACSSTPLPACTRQRHGSDRRASQSSSRSHVAHDAGRRVVLSVVVRRERERGARCAHIYITVAARSPDGHRPRCPGLPPPPPEPLVGGPPGRNGEESTSGKRACVDGCSFLFSTMPLASS